MTKPSAPASKGYVVTKLNTFPYLEPDAASKRMNELRKQMVKQYSFYPHPSVPPTLSVPPAVDIDALLDALFRRIELDQAIHRSSLEAELRLHLKQPKG